MRKFLMAVIALTMTIAVAEAQQKLHVWLKNGTHVSYDVTKVDSIGFYTPSYTLTVTVEGEGTVTGAGKYKMDEQATLTATPAEGYIFSNWSDGKTGNTRVETMTKDLTQHSSCPFPAINRKTFANIRKTAVPLRLAA